jgi:hypothetical protein
MPDAPVYPLSPFVPSGQGGNPQRADARAW